MSWWKSDTTASVSHSALTGTERRRDPRIGTRFTVRYSGADGRKIVMGHAVIVDLSQQGFGLTGSRGLKRGMELALFLELHESDRPLCIPQVQVLWVSGIHCGIQLPPKKSRTMDWMDTLLDGR
ncbi:MAG: PilZ domain-containing protein [Nitrospira sp.]|nr:MAG: PilZ domain-containing protein [Nitrospira sp.]